MESLENRFSQIAALIGDPVRSKILWVLLGGRAYTATELALHANTTPQNISMHLKKLLNAGLLNVAVQGRHKYYQYDRPEIPYAIEALINLVPNPRDLEGLQKTLKPIEYCRTCYDHLAGKIGVELTESFLRYNFIAKHGEDFDITPEGTNWFNSIDINIELLKNQKRAFARRCLDWSERRHHLAGSLGAALFNFMILDGWLRKVKNSREIVITAKGRTLLREHFKMDV